MKRSADDILPGAKRNPAPVQSDNTRVTPRRPQSGANNPNAATIRPVSRASQALNAARTVSTTVDAVASAAEAGVSLRRGDVGAAIVGAGLAGAAAMGVRSGRAARVAETGVASRVMRGADNAGRTEDLARRLDTARDSRRSISYMDAAMTPDNGVVKSVTEGGRIQRRASINPATRNVGDALRNPSSYGVGLGPERRVGPKLSDAAINRDLSVARKQAQAQNTPSGRPKTKQEAGSDFEALNNAKHRQIGKKAYPKGTK